METTINVIEQEETPRTIKALNSKGEVVKAVVLENTTQILVERIQKKMLLPYEDRVKPITEIYQSLLLLGYNKKQVKQIMKSAGVSQSLLFKANIRTPLHGRLP